MRLIIPALCCSICFAACNKTDEAVKSDHYRDIVYRVDSRDSALRVEFRRAVYDNIQKGNIRFDTTFPNPGVYTIPATVLAREQATLFGESYRSGDFDLQIIFRNAVIAETDTVPLDPANALHPDHWYTTITATPD